MDQATLCPAMLNFGTCFEARQQDSEGNALALKGRSMSPGSMRIALEAIG